MKGWIGVRQARWLSMLVLSAWLALAAAHAAPPPEPGFTPDPATVQRYQRLNLFVRCIHEWSFARQRPASTMPTRLFRGWRRV